MSETETKRLESILSSKKLVPAEQEFFMSIIKINGLETIVDFRSFYQRDEITVGAQEPVFFQILENLGLLTHSPAKGYALVRQGISVGPRDGSELYFVDIKHAEEFAEHCPYPGGRQPINFVKGFEYL